MKPSSPVHMLANSWVRARCRPGSTAESAAQACQKARDACAQAVCVHSSSGTHAQSLAKMRLQQLAQGGAGGGHALAQAHGIELPYRHAIQRAVCEQGGNLQRKEGRQEG